MQVDIPANSQLFGQLVVRAGIEGIVYPSKFNDRDCLAVFPQNFSGTGSFVELLDTPPAQTVTRRLDGTTQ